MRSRRPSSSTDDEDLEPASPLDGGDLTSHQFQASFPELTSIPGDCSYSKSAAISTATTIPSASQLPLSTSDKPTKPDTSTTVGKEKMEEPRSYRRVKPRSFWACSISTICVTILSAVMMVAIVHSFQKRQCDAKGCIKTYMSPAYAPLVNFDTEHTRFASKYKVYLYRERQYDTSSLDVCWNARLISPSPVMWNANGGTMLASWSSGIVYTRKCRKLQASSINGKGGRTTMGRASAHKSSN